MADRTKIEWARGADGTAGATWNPVRARNRATGKVGWHCTHASDGCRFCYAEGMNLRLGTGLAYKPGYAADVDIFLDEKMLLQPLRWSRARTIFVGSMTDLFADFVTDAMLDRIFAVMALSPHHTFQVLTKRPDRMRAYLDGYAAHVRIEHLLSELAPSSQWNGNVLQAETTLKSGLPLPNVWLGTSCEDQATADARIPELLATPAAIRFVSAEPLLGPIDFTRIEVPRVANADGFTITHPKQIDSLTGEAGHYPSPTVFHPKSHGVGARLDWIIVGGESGPYARPMHPAWEEGIRLQCAAAGVAYFRKQWGEWHPWGQTLADGSVNYLSFGKHPSRYRHLEGGVVVSRVGKARAGRLLDGVPHDGMPVREAVHA